MDHQITNCVRCRKEISVSFKPPVKRIDCIEVTCCDQENASKLVALIIDDDKSILRTLSRMLERSGFEVYTACNSKETMEEINSGRHFDIVISDLFIGDESGLPLLYTIRKKWPEIKTILMSGSRLSEEELSLISINDFLPKPFELKELRKKLQDMLNMEVPK